MPKVRCGACHNYLDRDDAVRNGVQSFHEDCIADAYKGSQPKRTKKKDMPDGLRDLIIALDGGRCRFCGRSNNVVLHAHHVVYRSEGGPHSQSNLITLCLGHHDEVHSDKKRYQPLCLGVIWLRAFGDKRITIPKLERKLNERT